MLAVALSVSLAASASAAERPLNFANDIEPILTKFACNSGGCHGKIQGQNGFRLSLLGFDPELDYATITQESRGRRVFPAAPAESLLVRKATGQMPHGGGRKLPPDSAEYARLVRWIAEGMPYGKPSDPKIVRIAVAPKAIRFGETKRQPLAVTAHYSDGSTDDVSKLAQYESNDTDVATVGEAGTVQAAGRTGQAGVMVRYAGHVDVVTAIAPRAGPAAASDFVAATAIDKLAAAKWRELNIAPSPRATDAEFLRRATLDIAGRLPTVAELAAFAKEPAADKRAKLVDRLLDEPGYADLFANKWADLLKVVRKNQPSRASGTFAFHAWIRESIAADVPFDRFVKSILTATGDEQTSPATVWYREVATPEQFADDASQVFLGQRLACANCHHHPYERWSQDDYWGFAAFAGRVGRKQVPIAGSSANNQQANRLVLYTKTGTVTNKKTGKPAPLAPLDGREIADGEGAREAFADWMTGPKNPFFARTLANRYWAHFFGRGIVDPVDDLRITNPPSNPELLDALAAIVVEKNFSLKQVIRTIATSETYQRSSLPNDSNADDRHSFARFYPKRLSAEVLADAVSQVTGSPTAFAGLPTDRHAPRRALQLPDESFASYFLDVTGRPQRLSACDCERVSEASLAMALHLMNSNEVQEKLSRPGGTAERLANDPRPDDEKIRELFRLAIAADPTDAQLAKAREHLAAAGPAKKAAYENMIWALINGKAFLFNR
jgi:hypothetical protein